MEGQAATRVCSVGRWSWRTLLFDGCIALAAHAHVLVDLHARNVGFESAASEEGMTRD